MLTSGTQTALRGLSVVNDRVIWVSGSNGMVGKSLDGGNTFVWMVIKGFEKTDFRDIEAMNDSTAVIMGISAPSYILRTSDGGGNWKVVYENKTTGMFLDAMEFWNEQRGIVLGDPINGNFFIAQTFDGGLNWINTPAKNHLSADSGEACFASSGTNIRKFKHQEAIFISGGASSHLFFRDKKILLPIVQGKESTGANSIAIKNNRKMIVVGGDFSNKDDSNKNCFITNNKGKNWFSPQKPPHGYRSCIEWLSKKSWVTCGLNGVDLSKDDGNNWEWISKESFHVCQRAKKGNAIFFAGTGGRIATLRDN